MKKFAMAHWEGSLKEGSGSLSTESGALDEQPYGFNTRFEDKPGTNPEELIGAAHAGCFSMALSGQLGERDITAERIDTRATVTLQKDDGGFSIVSVHLTLKLVAPGADKPKVLEAVKAAKEGCPVSKVLNAEISLDTEIIV